MGLHGVVPHTERRGDVLAAQGPVGKETEDGTAPARSTRSDRWPRWCPPGIRHGPATRRRATRRGAELRGGHRRGAQHRGTARACGHQRAGSHDPRPARSPWDDAARAPASRPASDGGHLALTMRAVPVGQMSSGSNRSESDHGVSFARWRSGGGSGFMWRASGRVRRAAPRGAWRGHRRSGSHRDRRCGLRSRIARHGRGPRSCSTRVSRLVPGCSAA